MSHTVSNERLTVEYHSGPKSSNRLPPFFTQPILQSRFTSKELTDWMAALLITNPQLILTNIIHLSQFHAMSEVSGYTGSDLSKLRAAFEKSVKAGKDGPYALYRLHAAHSSFSAVARARQVNRHNADLWRLFPKEMSKYENIYGHGISRNNTQTVEQSYQNYLRKLLSASVNMNGLASTNKKLPKVKLFMQSQIGKGPSRTPRDITGMTYGQILNSFKFT